LRRDRKGEESRELVRDSGGVEAGEESQDSALEETSCLSKTAAVISDRLINIQTSVSLPLPLY
jgi:hypothetical protein